MDHIAQLLDVSMRYILRPEASNMRYVHRRLLCALERGWSWDRCMNAPMRQRSLRRFCGHHVVNPLCHDWNRACGEYSAAGYNASGRTV